MLLDMEINHFILYREETLECLHELAVAAREREEARAKAISQRAAARKGVRRK